MFRITPKEKILTPGEYHCCESGTTPGELGSGGTDSGTVVDNGDGTITKSWTIGSSTAPLNESIDFEVCCATEGTFSWTAELPPFGGSLSIEINGSGDTMNVLTAGTIDFDDPVFTNYAPPTPCQGTRVRIEAVTLFTVGLTIKARP
jgi:hypothetical protein